jgi:hypothetical protein
MGKYLLIILFLSFFAALVYFLTSKRWLYGFLVGFVAIFGLAFGCFVPLLENTRGVIEHTFYNIAPSALFFLFVKFDLKRFFKGNIGCACTIGAKRYWLLVALAFFVSFVSQLLGFLVMSSFLPYSPLIIASVFGILASFTRFGSIGGVEEVAKTFILLFCLLGGVMLCGG